MDSTNGIAADRLKAIVDRIERMEAEKADILADIKEIYSEAKGAGFDVKILRQVLKLRKADKAELSEQEQLRAVYCRALDMAAPLPLFSEAAE